MLIDGVYKENISCKLCRFRHPADLSCADAKKHAEAGRASEPSEPRPRRSGLKEFVGAAGWIKPCGCRCTRYPDGVVDQLWCAEHSKDVWTLHTPAGRL